MKSSVLLLMIIFFISLVACRKNKDVEPDSNFKALKNDASWISTGSWANYSKKDRKFYLNGTRMDPKYYQEELLSFSFKMTDLSKSLILSEFGSSWNYIIGGDAVSDTYFIDSTAINNQLFIASVDSIKKQISGTFTVKLLHDIRYSDKGEVMQFSKGKFSLKYIELE